MKRYAEKGLNHWLKSANRKPLVLRGARQVGKSTLVRQFAASAGLDLHEINLERHMNLAKVFATFDIPRILEELGVIVGHAVDREGGLLFLDEIQGVPEALAALRYFYEDRPDIPVIAAGSLLEFALTERKLSMPVGRISYLHLGPMTFDEFLEEVEPALLPYCRQAVEMGRVPEEAHERLCRRVRQYLFVGGMPEAVKTYSSEGLAAVSDVQRSLMETYEDDFAKYAHGTDLALMQEIFRNLSPQVCAKVKYVNFSREVPSRSVKAVLDLFRKARVCNAVRASACDGVPLFADTEEGVWKELFLDVGLMNHACGTDWRMLEGMDGTRFINEGRMAEQFIGQHLLYREGGRAKPQLAYWLREGCKNNAEVDFVVSSGRQIYPIEVKAGKSGSLKSLRELILAKRFERAVRFDDNPPGRQRVSIDSRGQTVGYELLSLPLYSIGPAMEMLNGNVWPDFPSN